MISKNRFRKGFYQVGDKQSDVTTKINIFQNKLLHPGSFRNKLEIKNADMIAINVDKSPLTYKLVTGIDLRLSIQNLKIAERSHSRGINHSHNKLTLFVMFFQECIDGEERVRPLSTHI